MEILEIRMDHFGKFNGQSMTFHPGVNIIYGDNETGKSTMRAFIRDMFYGIDRMRGRAAQQDEYSLRQPWKNGSYFSGMLRFRSKDKIYRIERNFEKRDKAVRLICETEGRELDAEELSGFLQDMDETAFSNTVFYGGQSGETDEGLANAVRNGMINAGSGSLSGIDGAKAMEELKEERKRLEREKKQKVAAKIEKMQELSVKIDYAQQELEQLTSQEMKQRERLKALEEEIGEAGEAYSRAAEEDIPGNAGTPVWKIGKITMAVIAVAALAVALVMSAWQVRAGAVAVILLACLGVQFFGVRDQKQKDRMKEQEAYLREQRMRREYERQKAQYERQQRNAPKKERLLANLEWAVNARKEKQVMLEELQEQQKILKKEKGEVEELEQKLSAVYLAIDTLSEVMNDIYQEYAQKLNERISEILLVITCGKYTGAYLDENFQVRVSTPQKLLSIWQVSRGTMEQIYFALRMACAEFLNQEDALPLILDDAFLTYDDTRLEQTLRWLALSGRQVLLFTCHRREQEILKRIYE